MEKIIISNREKELEITVIYSKRKTMGLQIRANGDIFARVPEKTRDSEIRKFAEKYRDWIFSKSEQMEKRKNTWNRIPAVTDPQKLEELKKLLNQKAEYFAEIMGVSYKRITVKNQKTRWGSCSSAGNLNFNCRLYSVPEPVLDYVVVHELAHRKYMNHSRLFWEEVRRYMPDYTSAYDYLKHTEII